jgi:hypothetical protein
MDPLIISIGHDTIHYSKHDSCKAIQSSIRLYFEKKS